MDQAGVLARPAQSRRRCQRPLHHRPRVHKGARLKLAELLVQTCLQCFHPLEQHLVIVAGAPRAVLGFHRQIGFARPGVAGNPSRALGGRLSRARLRGVVVRKANHCRPRPGKRNPRPQKPPILAGPLQVTHRARAARLHPLFKALGVTVLICVGKRNQPGLGETCFQRQGTH